MCPYLVFLCVPSEIGTDTNSESWRSCNPSHISSTMAGRRESARSTRNREPSTQWERPYTPRWTRANYWMIHWRYSCMTETVRARPSGVTPNLFDRTTFDINFFNVQALHEKRQLFKLYFHFFSIKLYFCLSLIKNL